MMQHCIDATSYHNNIILVEVFAVESIIDESFWHRRDFFVKGIGRELFVLLNKKEFVLDSRKCYPNFLF